MAEETASSSRSNILWGLFAAAMGAFIVAGACNLLGLDLHPEKDTPSWIGICAGLVFVAGGFAVILQSLPAAKPMPDGSLSPDAPRWVQGACFALGLSIVGGLAAIGLWVAFGPGERHFSMSIGFGSGPANEMLGRVVFGFGAVLTCLMFLAFLVSGARRFLRRDKV
jgi:hypothetical protein